MDSITTISISLATAFLAYMQWRTYEKQHKLALSERIAKNHDEMVKVYFQILTFTSHEDLIEIREIVYRAVAEAKISLPSSIIKNLEKQKEKVDKLFQLQMALDALHLEFPEKCGEDYRPRHTDLYTQKRIIVDSFMLPSEPFDLYKEFCEPKFWPEQKLDEIRDWFIKRYGSKKHELKLKKSAK